MLESVKDSAIEATSQMVLIKHTVGRVVERGGMFAHSPLPWAFCSLTGGLVEVQPICTTIALDRPFSGLQVNNRLSKWQAKARTRRFHDSGVVQSQSRFRRHPIGRAQ